MAELSVDRPLRQIIADEIHRLNPEDRSLINGAVSAILDAVADAIVPEEPMVVPGGRTYEQAWLASERERLRNLLLAEADRAEAGDG